MTFQAYLDTIKNKTGKTPDELKEIADRAGIFRPDMKFNELKHWLKKDYGLGHGHSMAVWAVFKQKGWVNPPEKK